MTVSTKEKRVLNKVGEQVLCGMFGVNHTGMISKPELSVVVVEQNEMIKNLLKCLFRENSNHQIFCNLDQPTMEKIRRSRFA